MDKITSDEQFLRAKEAFYTRYEPGDFEEMDHYFGSEIPTADVDDSPPYWPAENKCQECGRSNVAWFAPNEIWNQVMTPEGEAVYKGPPGILCPSCFAIKAAKRGFETSWEFRPRDYEPTAAAVPDVDCERVAQMIAHRACCGTEHDPSNGKIHGYCVVCGVPWPCEYVGPRPTTPAPPTVSPDVEKTPQWLADEMEYLNAWADGPLRLKRQRERQ